MPVSLVATKGIVSLCGDKISSCRRDVQVENSHPHGMGKLAPHLSCGDEISSCRRDVQVENLHPHGKMCTHMGKLAPTKGLECSSFRIDPGDDIHVAGLCG